MSSAAGHTAYIRIGPAPVIVSTNKPTKISTPKKAQLTHKHGQTRGAQKSSICTSSDIGDDIRLGVRVRFTLSWGASGVKVAVELN